MFNLGNWVTAFEIRSTDIAYCPPTLRRVFSGNYKRGYFGADIRSIVYSERISPH